MISRRYVVLSVLLLNALYTAHPQAQGRELFTATATVATEAGAPLTAPVAIVVMRKMTRTETDKFVAAFNSGGAAGLRRALVGVPPTGSVQLGARKTPIRLTIERASSAGRLITMVTDRPLLDLGVEMPGAKSKQGYDFGVIDIDVDTKGGGHGSLAPAASIAVRGGTFVVEDYADEVISLTAVARKP
jgi:hypothetical protein